MAGTILPENITGQHGWNVSMESGLDGRNNRHPLHLRDQEREVSMESGLDGRNNAAVPPAKGLCARWVSMESGLDGRNNRPTSCPKQPRTASQWSPA